MEYYRDFKTKPCFLATIYHADFMSIGLWECWAEGGFSAYWHSNGRDMKPINNLNNFLTFRRFDLCCFSRVPGPWGFMMIAERVPGRLLRRDKKVLLLQLFWGKLDLPISAERVRECASVQYVMLSLAGVDAVLVQIRWAGPACVPALCVSQPGIMPTSGRPGSDGGACEAFALKKHFYLQSRAVYALLHSLHVFFSEVTNMTLGIGCWDWARETQMSGARLGVWQAPLDIWA